MTDEIQRRGLLRSLTACLADCSYEELRVLDVPLQTLLMIRAGGDRQWQRRIATGPGDVDRSWHLARYRAGFRPASVVTLCSGSWAALDAIETSLNPPLEERCHACWREACGGSAIGMALLEVVGQLAILDRDRAELREQVRDEMVPRRARRPLNIVSTTWNPSSNAWICRIGDPDNDWEAVRVDGVWFNEHAQCDVTDPAVIDELEDAVRRKQPVQIGTVPGDDMSDRVVVDDPDAEFALDHHRTRLDSTSEVIALCEQARERDPDREVDLLFDVSDAEEPVGVHGPGGELDGWAG